MSVHTLMILYPSLKAICPVFSHSDYIIYIHYPILSQWSHNLIRQTGCFIHTVQKTT